LRVSVSKLLFAGSLVVGCRCSDGPAPASTASGGSAGAAGAAPDCQQAEARITLLARGEHAGAAIHSDASAEPEPEIDLPFSVEPGMALELGGAFYATALRHEPHGEVALLARLPRSVGQQPAMMELMRLEGDVPPPRLAVAGADLLVAIEQIMGEPRSPSSGYQVRMVRLSAALLAGTLPPAEPLQWHEGPTASRDESNAFDFAAALPAVGTAVAPGGALFTWDDWPRGENHGRVYVQAIGSDGRSGPPAAVSSALVDAEEPRLVARPGGYWLAWLVDVASVQGRARSYDPGESEVAAAGGGSNSGGSTGSPAPSANPNANGARAIEVLALDAAGQPAGNVRRIRTESSRVVGYDLTTNSAGQAWVVWRQDASSAGAAGGRVLMAEVRSDGPHEIVPLREDDVGSGEPTWLAPASPLQEPWLTFPDQRDRTLLVPVEYPHPASAPLALAPDLQGAAALAAVSGRVLFAQPRGRSLELFVAACAATALQPGR
jgi:hypothetical protein